MNTWSKGTGRFPLDKRLALRKTAGLLMRRQHVVFGTGESARNSKKTLHIWIGRAEDPSKPRF